MDDIKKERRKQWRKLTYAYEVSHAKGKHRSKWHRKLRDRIRNRIARAVRRYVISRKFSCGPKDLGCSMEEFVKYFESMFQPGMSWDNYGNKPGCWSIDHILPLFWFDLFKEDQAKKASHYTNLQPMWCDANARKNMGIYSHPEKGLLLLP